MKKWIACGVVGALVVASIIVDWPWGHTFGTHTWPGPFGWIATNTPGNLAAGFLQVGIGFALGVTAHRVGLTERAKQWATKDLHTEIARSHELLHHVIKHHPHIPDMPHRDGRPS